MSEAFEKWWEESRRKQYIYGNSAYGKCRAAWNAAIERCTEVVKLEQRSIDAFFVGDYCEGAQAALKTVLEDIEKEKV